MRVVVALCLALCSGAHASGGGSRSSGSSGLVGSLSAVQQRWSSSGVAETQEAPAGFRDFNATGPLSPRWVVITSINAPTAPVRAFDALPGWYVVVVGDVPSPPDAGDAWRALRKTVFLDLEAQAQLPYALLPLLPLRHYARKNIGACPIGKAWAFGPCLWWVFLGSRDGCHWQRHTGSAGWFPLRFPSKQ